MTKTCFIEISVSDPRKKFVLGHLESIKKDSSPLEGSMFGPNFAHRIKLKSSSEMKNIGSLLLVSLTQTVNIFKQNSLPHKKRKNHPLQTLQTLMYPSELSDKMGDSSGTSTTIFQHFE